MGITGCNLCLVTITNCNFNLLKDDLKDKLQVLIPVINWGNICREPKVCHKCCKIIKRTYQFKTYCLDNNKRLKKLKNVEDPDSEEDNIVCCLCLQEDISIDFAVDANVNLKDMVRKCFPQLNIYSSNNQGVCDECLICLKKLDSFTNSCLESETYVKSYCSTMNIIRRDRFDFDECIKRRNFPHITINLARESESISQETEIPTTRNNDTIETAQESTGFLQEKKCISKIIDSKENVMEQNRLAESPPELRGSEKTKKTQPSRQFCCGNCDYIANSKSALASHMMKHKDPSTLKMHMCKLCGHQTKRKGDLKWHMIVHKDPEEVKLYYCAHCSHCTKRKGDLKQHVAIHGTRLFKCDVCLFETKNQFYLKTYHMLVHAKNSDNKTIKCEHCPYEAKTKLQLKEHSRIHVEKVKCNWCNFETIYKQGLKKHLLIHKCRSERELFKCHLCGFEGGHKHSLRKHMLTHDNNSSQYECEKCGFKTKRKQSLKGHLQKHKFELSLHGCCACPFKTHYKRSLKDHLVYHITNLDTVSYDERVINSIISQLHILNFSG